jgi:hypothetical protein
MRYKSLRRLSINMKLLEVFFVEELILFKVSRYSTLQDYGINPESTARWRYW